MVYSGQFCVFPNTAQARCQILGSFLRFSNLIWQTGLFCKQKFISIVVSGAVNLQPIEQADVLNQDSGEFPDVQDGLR
jgi:hypothetical protein